MKKILKSRFTKFFLAFLALGGFVCLPEMALAQNSSVNNALEGFAAIASMFVSIFTVIAIVLMDAGADLAGNRLLTGEVIYGSIQPMWKIIRDYVYICFVIFFVFLAFANIFSKEGNWTIKDKLPRAILALILINFSLWGIRIAIETVNVGAVGIAGMADGVIKNQGISNVKQLIEATPRRIGDACGQASGHCSNEQAVSLKNAIEEILCSEKNTKKCILYFNEEKINAQKPPKTDLFKAIGVQIMALGDMPRIAANTGGITGVISDAVISTFFALAIIIVMVMLFVALIGRLIVLWLAMIFSPVLVAAWTLGVNLPGEGSGGIKEYIINALIMPLKVAIALTLGFILLSTAINIPLQFSILEVGGVLEKTFTGSIAGVIWKIAAIVVLWMAAKWSMDKTISKTVTDKISGGAEGFAKFAGSYTMQNIPVIGAGVSAMHRAPALLNQKLNEQRINQTKGLEDLLGLNNEVSDTLRKLGGEITTADGLMKHLTKDNIKNQTIQEAVMKKLEGNQALRQNMKDKYDIKYDDLKNKNLAEIATTFNRAIEKYESQKNNATNQNQSPQSSSQQNNNQPQAVNLTENAIQKLNKNDSNEDTTIKINVGGGTEREFGITKKTGKEGGMLKLSENTDHNKAAAKILEANGWDVVWNSDEKTATVTKKPNTP